MLFKNYHGNFGFHCWFYTRSVIYHLSDFLADSVYFHKASAKEERKYHDFVSISHNGQNENLQ